MEERDQHLRPIALILRRLFCWRASLGKGRRLNQLEFRLFGQAGSLLTRVLGLSEMVGRAIAYETRGLGRNSTGGHSAGTSLGLSVLLFAQDA